MNTPIGNNNSWWYSNRSSSECVNVKIHAFPDIKEIISLLTPKEQQIITILKLDIPTFIENHMWESIQWDKESNEEYLKEQYPDIHSFTYAGRSYGWCCVEYKFDELYEELENIVQNYPISLPRTKIKYVENLNTAYIHLQEALAVINKVNKDIANLVSVMEKDYETADTYIEPLKEYIQGHEERALEKLKALSELE